ncbi:MAG: putrescine export ABC transporter permease SapC [Plesiomonas sp.]|uniref:putrescine export ABC transporter permease SapC n=1 Tax=Plesiomonas sp. TaxID=2486279 RepID=UPI003F35085C
MSNRLHMPTRLAHTWNLFRKDSISAIGFYGLLILLMLTAFGQHIAPFSANFQFIDKELMPPSWSSSGKIEFFFGTDDLGRDIFSRLLCGARFTFGSALLVVCSASIVGIAIGILAGMSKGLKSSILNHTLDAILSIPTLLLAIIVVALTGAGLLNAMFAVWLALVPRFVRAVYTAVHDEMEKDHITAIRLDGASDSYILRYAVLPNILAILVMEFTRGFSVALLDIAALGFLDLGAQRPSPEWGAMLGEALSLLYIAPWTVTLPGLAILISVIIVNLAGDGLHRAINAGTE